jgi:hypothetical protein
MPADSWNDGLSLWLIGVRLRRHATELDVNAGALQACAAAIGRHLDRCARSHGSSQVRCSTSPPALQPCLDHGRAGLRCWAARAR